MKEKPINIYWTHNANNDEYIDFSSLYPKPKILFKDIRSHKLDTVTNDSVLACPAVSNKFKKTLVFESPLSCSYEYDFTDGKQDIKPTSEAFIGHFIPRPASLDFGPQILFDLAYLFFSDEPLPVSFTAPYFHKPEYTKYGTIFAGEFDIGQWFRPFNFEVQMWNQKGEIYLKEEEPIFYAEFKTQRPIHIRRFNKTTLLDKYSTENVTSSHMFGRGQSLFDRYNRFNRIGMREKILTEINKNLIDEEPFIL